MKCSPIGRFASSYISTPKAHSTKLKTAWGPYITRCGSPQWWGLGGMPCSDRLRRLAAPAGALRPRRLQSSARHASQAPYLPSIASNSPQTEGAHTLEAEARNYAKAGIRCTARIGHPGLHYYNKVVRRSHVSRTRPVSALCPIESLCDIHIPTLPNTSCCEVLIVKRVRRRFRSCSARSLRAKHLVARQDKQGVPCRSNTISRHLMLLRHLLNRILK